MKPSPWKDDTLTANGHTVRDNFAHWFGASKVVDGQGQPLVVYHATTSEFTVFDLEKTGQSNRFGPGFYFSCDPRTLDVYSGHGDGRVLPVFLRMENPKIGNDLTPEEINRFFSVLRDKVFANGYDATADHEHIRQQALAEPEFAFSRLLSGQICYISKEDWRRGMEAMGYDGLIREVYGQPEYVVLRSQQVKLAHDNCGIYELQNPDISDRNLQQAYLARQAAQAIDRPCVLLQP